MSVDIDQCNQTWSPQTVYIQQHTTLTIGQWYWGSVAENISQGIIYVLVIEYFRRYPRDDWKQKAYVAFLAIASTLKTVDIFAIMWHKLILSFGNWTLISSLEPWYCPLEAFFSEIVCIICQLYFIMRLWRLLGNNYLLFVPFIPATLMGVGGNLAVSLQVLQNENPDAATLKKWDISSIVGLVGVLVSDLVVTGAATYHLWHSKTGKQTDPLFWRIFNVIWATALPPAIAALLNLALFLAPMFKQGNNAFIAWNIWMPKLYCISVLYVLNSRTPSPGKAAVWEGESYISSGVRTGTGVHFADAPPGHPIAQITSTGSTFFPSRKRRQQQEEPQPSSADDISMSSFDA